MVFVDSISPLFPPLDYSSYTYVSPLSTDLSLPFSGLSFVLHDASFSSYCFNEVESSTSASFINSLHKDDYAYIPNFKKLDDGSYMHIGKLVEVNISDDPNNPKIYYLGEVLDES